MDIAGEADVEDEVDRDGGREFRSGAISYIVAVWGVGWGTKESNGNVCDVGPRTEDKELRLGPGRWK
jgi:hypothetical protein